MEEREKGKREGEGRKSGKGGRRGASPPYFFASTATDVCSQYTHGLPLILHVTRTKGAVTRRVYDSPNAFWRPGSARTRAPPNPLAAIGGGVLLLRGIEERGGEGR